MLDGLEDATAPLVVLRGWPAWGWQARRKGVAVATEEAAAASAEIVSLDEAQVEQALRGEIQQVSVAIEDPQAIALSIIKRILSSEDADEVFGGQEAVGGRDVLGRPFTLHGVTWHRSKYDEGGLPVFAVLDGTFLDDGERKAITTGATNIMAQVFQLKKLGALPQDVKIEEAAQETAQGYRPQWLVKAVA